jgi:hypothetical protein
MHKIMLANEKIPGHINREGLVEIIAIIRKVSTVLSQNISNIPPNFDVSLNLANVPSNASNTKEMTIKITPKVKKSTDQELKPLRKINTVLNNPKKRPSKVIWLGEIFPRNAFLTNFSTNFSSLDFTSQLSSINMVSS